MTPSSPLVVDDDLLFGIDDQIVPNALKREITDEFVRVVVTTGRRRHHFDDDHRVLDGKRVWREFRAAIDKRVRLENGMSANPYGHAVRQHMAWQAAGPYRVSQGDGGGQLDFGVRRPLGGLGVYHPVDELEAPLLSFAPDEIFLDGHAVFRARGHGEDYILSHSPGQ